MLSQYAFAKLQSIHGEQYFLHGLPSIISSKRCREYSLVSQSTTFTKNKCINSENPQYLALTNITSTFPVHAIIYYSQSQYRIISISGVKVNDQSLPQNHQAIQQLSQPNLNFQSFINQHQTHSLPLSPLTKIFIISPQPTESEIYYFCLPLTTPQRINTTKIPQQTNNSVSVAPMNQTNGSKWSNDDHEQLKKLLLQYGYGRWKQIQRSSSSMGGKLETKSLPEVKAYANSFLRALGLTLPQDETNLKVFLQKLIEENNQEYLEYQPNIKQWDPHIVFPQRSVQYTKRLQLLYRVKTLIRKYRDETLKNMVVKDRHKINWDALLNFIPLGLLFGQRPAVWWAKKHDIDLLLGVYKYGYANYVAIRNAKQYCFAQLEKAQTYQDLPVADNLTRRLKKLINTIVKIQQNQGEIDFDEEASSEEDQKTWNDLQKKTLFNILVDYGVPITSDNRSNWIELKDKVKAIIKEFSKTPGQVEKMVSRIRWNCQEIISDEKAREELSQIPNNGVFKITYDQAVKFCRNINILQFVRRSIITMDEQNYKLFLKEAQQKEELLQPDHPAYIQNSKNADQQILNHVNKVGITSNNPLKINQGKVLARVEWLCEIFKQVKEKLYEKKKKYKSFDDNAKKRAKFQISRDKQGNIKFPININPSLVLVATGRICSTPNYHSEHNLFPIGYISIRTHASMFTRGVRAKYRCQILEGDGKPIYKVTPEEDPDNPIIRDSSTGCWVHICQKVNNLQQVKKQKVTISGTQRFGLLQPNVVRLLEDLPQAQKCTKYKFKKNLPQGSKQ